MMGDLQGDAVQDSLGLLDELLHERDVARTVAWEAVRLLSDPQRLELRRVLGGAGDSLLIGAAS